MSEEEIEILLDQEYEDYLTEMYNLKTGNFPNESYMFSELEIWKMTEQEDGDYVV